MTPKPLYLSELDGLYVVVVVVVVVMHVVVVVVVVIGQYLGEVLMGLMKFGRS